MQKCNVANGSGEKLSKQFAALYFYVQMVDYGKIYTPLMGHDYVELNEHNFETFRRD